MRTGPRGLKPPEWETLGRGAKAPLFHGDRGFITGSQKLFGGKCEALLSW